MKNRYYMNSNQLELWIIIQPTLLFNSCKLLRLFLIPTQKNVNIRSWTSWVRSCICWEPAVSGACCPMTFRPITQSFTTSTSGSGRGLWVVDGHASSDGPEIPGREETPSLGITDSKSVKSSHHVETDLGIDGNKKTKGRKVYLR